MNDQLIKVTDEITKQSNVLLSLTTEFSNLTINIKDVKPGDCVAKQKALISNITRTAAELSKLYKDFNRLRNDINNYKV